MRDDDEIDRRARCAMLEILLSTDILVDCVLSTAV
jgi:hypothetical protein